MEEYKQKEYIPSFYENIQDFTDYHSEILLEGTTSFKNWYEKSPNLVLYDSIRPERDNIYLFSNSNLNEGQMYIAINVENWQDAVNIVYFWNKNSYIPDYEDISRLDHADFSFFTYENKNNIEKFKIENGNNKVNVVGYKWNSNPQYTALLKI